jgi:hypothetical protein
MAAAKRPHHKKKTSARANAQNRSQAQFGLAEPPRVPRSNQRISQERFPGETPLTGEDRASVGRGLKHRGFQQDLEPRRVHGLKRDASPDLSAPPQKRRSTRRSSDAGDSPRERR